MLFVAVCLIIESCKLFYALNQSIWIILYKPTLKFNPVDPNRTQYLTILSPQKLSNEGYE